MRMNKTESKKESMLRKVRGLLDKADSTDHEAEANTFREKADELMTIYAIEAWQVEMNRPEGERAKPEMREYDFGTNSSDVDNQLTTMMPSLCRLTRCKIGYRSMRTMKVVGFDTDLDYLDLLITSIRIEISRQMVPGVDKNETYDQNVFNLKHAGLGWQDIYSKMMQAYPERFQDAVVDEPEHLEAFREGLTDPNKKYLRHYYHYSDVTDQLFTQKFNRKYGAKWFMTPYKRHLKLLGEEQITIDPQVYRRSWLRGFGNEIRDRVADLRSAQEETTSGHEIVLANRDEDLLNLLWEIWPEQKPHPEWCECAQCHYRRCDDPKCKQKICVDMRKPVRYAKPRMVVVDGAAGARGARAAGNVDLSGGRNNLKSQRGIK